MQKKLNQLGSHLPTPVVPTAVEAEQGLASIAANHPQVFVKVTTEKAFNINDIVDPICKALVGVIITQESKGASTDIRIVFEKCREINGQIGFHQLSELWSYCPVHHHLSELINIVKSAAKRRALLSIAYKVLEDIGSNDITTAEIVSGAAVDIEGLNKDLHPATIRDTKTLLVEALCRYEEGDDQTQRIRTGFSKLDNMTPIRYGDFLVIGGHEKSGKSMFATNIIANIISNEEAKSNCSNEWWG